MWGELVNELDVATAASSSSRSSELVLSPCVVLPCLYVVMVALLLPLDLDDDEWSQYGYYKQPIGIGEEGTYSDYIRRIHINDTNREDFQMTYEASRTPVMVDGICQQWPAWTAWSLENILRRYGDTRMKCGEDDDGRSIRLRVWKYLEYMKHQQDDSPIYLFEGSFDEDKKCRRLLDECVACDIHTTDTLLLAWTRHCGAVALCLRSSTASVPWTIHDDRYTPPDIFQPSLFSLVKESRRPPYRWFLIGPKRSGTTVHVDPLGTSVCVFARARCFGGIRVYC